MCSSPRAGTLPDLKRQLVDFGGAAGPGAEDRLDLGVRCGQATSRAPTFCQDRGYTLHHTSWILGLDPETPIAGRVLPEGYAVRPFTAADAEATYRVVTDAFGEWDDKPHSFEAWRAGTLDRPHVDPSAFRLATLRGRGDRRSDRLRLRRRGLGGSARRRPRPSAPWRGPAASRRDVRGRAGTRGAATPGLSTDTRTGALDLYLRLGMRVKFTLNNCELDLSGG